MKSYKEYDREFIGDSDIAALTFVGTTKNGLKANILDFGSDGRYNAYIVVQTKLNYIVLEILVVSFSLLERKNMNKDGGKYGIKN